MAFLDKEDKELLLDAGNQAVEKMSPKLYSELEICAFKPDGEKESVIVQNPHWQKIPYVKSITLKMKVLCDEEGKVIRKGD